MIAAHRAAFRWRRRDRGGRQGRGHARIGERVWVWNAQWKRPFGTAAEFMPCCGEQAVRLPENITFAAGACLGIPALTALHAVRLLGPIGGKTLLITGGGSAVGHYAIQLAKLQGARIIATASDAKAQHARNAGADFIVDYKSKDVPAGGRAPDQGQGRRRHDRHGSVDRRDAAGGRRSGAAFDLRRLRLEHCCTTCRRTSGAMLRKIPMR